MGDTMTSDSNRFPNELFRTLRTVVIECIAGGQTTTHGDVPPWFEALFETPRTPDLHGLAFLENFLEAAEVYWDDAAEVEPFPSGVWFETTRDGTELPLEATAVKPDGRRVVLIKKQGMELDNHRQAIQDARNAKLDRIAQLTEANRQLSAEIVERKRAEERAARLRTELAHMDRLSAMGEMASGIAHELNQPLSAIVNYMKGCRNTLDAETFDRERVQTAVDRAAEQAERAGRIIHGIRAFVAKSRLDHVETSVNGLVDEVVSLLAHDLRRGQVDLVLELDPSDPRLRVDPIQVQQVVLNLMRNAIEALERQQPPRTIVVRTHTKDSMVKVEVRDNGITASPVPLDRLFESFFTTKSTEWEWVSPFVARSSNTAAVKFTPSRIPMVNQA